MSKVLHSHVFDNRPIRPANQAQPEISWDLIKTLLEDEYLNHGSNHIVQLNITTTGISVVTAHYYGKETSDEVPKQ